MDRYLAARVNAILLECSKKKRFATPLVLQKLVYLNYTLYLKNNGNFLKYLDFQAWTYGPVIPDLYYYYKNMGINSNDTILRRAEHGGSYPILQHDSTIKETIKRYSALDAYKLVDLTHKRDGAWYKAFCKGPNEEIPHEDIKEEFCSE